MYPKSLLLSLVACVSTASAAISVSSPTTSWVVLCWEVSESWASSCAADGLVRLAHDAS